MIGSESILAFRCVATSVNAKAAQRSNMTLHHMLRCVAITLTLVATQRNARINSDPILAFLCFASLRLIAKKALKVLIRNICVSQINATQSLASHCEPALICNSGIQLQRTG